MSTVNIRCLPHDEITYQVYKLPGDAGAYEAYTVDNPFYTDRDLSVQYVAMLQAREHRIAEKQNRRAAIIIMFESISKTTEVYRGDVGGTNNGG